MFADRLKEARKAKKFSQAEISRMLGVTQQAVGKWETGRSTPDPQTVARLAEIWTPLRMFCSVCKRALRRHRRWDGMPSAVTLSV